VSYRLGGIDGVSVEAAKWAGALGQLGLEVVTVAGDGRADRLVAGLDAWADRPVDLETLRSALDGADVVVAENICSLPLNRRASETVADLLRGRPSILHHHDLAWQRPGLGEDLADDPTWLHVTVNHLSRRQLADRGVGAETLYNHFAVDAAPSEGAGTRAALGVDAGACLVLQPTRAIARKNVATGLATAALLDGSFWLTGPTEEGYDEELATIIDAAPVPVIHRPAPGTMDEAYAAADAVVLPSSWEGFGNPSVEASIHRRPVLVGPYPVAAELEEELGFGWFKTAEQLAEWMDAPDPEPLDHNRAVAAEHLDIRALPGKLKAVLERLDQ
jgi:mannosylglucosylglycerate synthase